MSARFFKILVGVFLAHLVMLSVIWVGFSAPLPRLPATFTYEGSLPAEDGGGEDVWQKGGAPDQLTLDHPETSYANQWTVLRSPSKPLTYDHLGF